MIPSPDLLFLVLLGRKARKTTKKQGLIISSEPPQNSWLGKKGKDQKSKEFLAKEKARKSQPSKEKKIREVALSIGRLRFGWRV